jgi:hypothetical protein
VAALRSDEEGKRTGTPQCSRRTIRLQGDLFSSQPRRKTNNKLRTIALAMAFALSSTTFALAQQNGATGAQGGCTGENVPRFLCGDCFDDAAFPV